MPRISDDDLKALRVKHTRGLVVLSACNEKDEVVHDFVFKKPDRAAFARYRAAVRVALHSGGGSGEEEIDLARALCVWPEDKALFDELREDAPSLVHSFGVELSNEADAGLSLKRDPR